MSRLIVALGCLLPALGAFPAAGMSITDVLDLLEAGVGESVILDQMEAEEALFLLSTEDLVTLKRAGASDDLLRAMISRDGEKPLRSSGDWTEAYYRPSRIRVNLYYDPFGYHWYGWPHYFSYYYPFWWSHCGFYHAGWWSRSWCDWGPTTRWYWDRYHWHRHASRTDGRHAWSRETPGRYVAGRSASGSRGRVVTGREVPDARRGREEWSRPTREATRDVRSAPAGVQRPATPRSGGSRPDRPDAAPRSRPARPAREARHERRS